jgi:hypothetical protein
MGFRVVKHLGSRSCPADDAKVLMMVPTFPGEKLSWVTMSAYFASGDDSSVDQPSELNWYGLFLPWATFWATDLMISGGGAEDYGDVADFDALFEQWVLETAADGTEYYGGDVDQDPEEVAGEEEHADEELMDSGPIGPVRWFSREVVMRPYAAEGVNTIRFGDDFEAHLGKLPSAGMGGLHMIGVVRHEHAAETNFNIELDDATSKAGMGLLMAGDYTKAQAIIEANTANLGDYVRTILFGGDNYIEADTLKGAAGKGTIKGQFGISTPLSRRRSM